MKFFSFLLAMMAFVGACIIDHHVLIVVTAFLAGVSAYFFVFEG